MVRAEVWGWTASFLPLSGLGASVQRFVARRNPALSQLKREQHHHMSPQRDGAPHPTERGKTVKNETKEKEEEEEKGRRRKAWLGGKESNPRDVSSHPDSQRGSR